MNATSQLISRFIRVVALVAVSAGLAATAADESAATGTVTVTGLKGMARYSDDHATWKMLQQGDALKNGCVIQAAGESAVDLAVKPPGTGASILRLQAGSILEIEEMTSEGTLLDLRAGGIAGRAGKSPRGSRLEIRLNKAVAGVRGGSVFQLESSGKVAVQSGSAIVSEAADDGSVANKVVPDHHQLDPATGAITAAPALVVDYPADAATEEEPKAAPYKANPGLPDAPLRKF